MFRSSFVSEETPEGRDLVVTGPWSRKLAKRLERGDVDGLVLNYARGFFAPDLDFTEPTILALAPHTTLEQLNVKVARRLESLDGVEALTLRSLQIVLAPALADFAALSGLAKRQSGLAITHWRCCNARPDPGLRGCVLWPAGRPLQDPRGAWHKQ